MKKILLTTTALIALGIAPAAAADLAARPYTKAPATAPAMTTGAGFYAGVRADEPHGTRPHPPPPPLASTTASAARASRGTDLRFQPTDDEKAGFTPAFLFGCTAAE